MRIVIYARVSTRDKQNIETQISFLQDYAKRNNLQITETYKDIGESGKKDSRPAFDKLLSDMREGKFEGVLVYKLDRIGRSLSHLLQLFQEFQNRKISFISATQNINTTTPEGRMFLHLLMILAEFERELIVNRINAGLQRAKSEGRKLGRPKGKRDTKQRRKSGYYLRWKAK